MRKFNKYYAKHAYRELAEFAAQREKELKLFLTVNAIANSDDEKDTKFSVLDFFCNLKKPFHNLA